MADEAVQTSVQSTGNDAGLSVADGQDPFEAAHEASVKELGEYANRQQQSQQTQQPHPVPGQPTDGSDRHQRTTPPQQTQQQMGQQPPPAAKPSPFQGQKVKNPETGEEYDLSEAIEALKNKDTLWSKWYKQHEPKFQEAAALRKQWQTESQRIRQEKEIIEKMKAEMRGQPTQQPQRGQMPPEMQRQQIPAEWQEAFNDPITGNIARAMYQQNQEMAELKRMMSQNYEMQQQTRAGNIKNEIDGMRKTFGPQFDDVAQKVAVDLGMKPNPDGSVDYSRMDDNALSQFRTGVTSYISGVNQFQEQFNRMTEGAITKQAELQNMPLFRGKPLSRFVLDSVLQEIVEQHVRNPDQYLEPSQEMLDEVATEFQKALLQWRDGTSMQRAATRTSAVKPVVPSGSSPQPRTPGDNIEVKQTSSGDVDWDALATDSYNAMPPLKRR